MGSFSVSVLGWLAPLLLGMLLVEWSLSCAASAPAPAGVATGKRALERAQAYRPIVELAAARHRVSPRLIHAVIQAESSYRADAVSPRGAVGLMQLLPATAARYGVTDLADPAQNILAGTRHLRDLLTALDEDVALALAAYNAGIGAVLRHGGVPPFPETARYVVRVLELHEGELARTLAPRAAPYRVSPRPNQQSTFSLTNPAAATLGPSPNLSWGTPLRGAAVQRERQPGDHRDQRAGGSPARRDGQTAHPDR